MIRRTHLIVRGRNPYIAAVQFALRHGILREAHELRDNNTIIDVRRLSGERSHVTVDAIKLRNLQERQGMLAEPASSLGPPYPHINIRDRIALLSTKTPVERREKRQYREVLDAMRGALKDAGVPFEEVPADHLKSKHRGRYPLAFSLGGDGTFLRTAHVLGNTCGILPVNSWPGRSVAKFAPLHPDDLPEALRMILDGSYVIWYHTAVQGILRNRGDRERIMYALNEIAVRETQPDLFTTRWMLQWGGMKSKGQGNGLYVSSGGGSTASTFDAGGHVFAQDADLLEMTAEKARGQRPGDVLVINNVFGRSMVIASQARGNMRVIADGRRPARRFPPGARLHVSALPEFARTIHMPELERRNASAGPAASHIVPDLSAAVANRPYEPSPTLLEELGRVSLWKGIGDDERRQLVLFDIGPEMEYLNIVGVQKLGNAPLDGKAFDVPITIRDPRLVYPTAQLAGLPAGMRDMALQFYRYPFSVLHHRGVVVERDITRDGNIPTPNVDTILFHEALLESGLLARPIRSAAQINAGTGFMAKALFRHVPNLERYYLRSGNDLALACARRNNNNDPRLILQNVQSVADLPTVDLLLAGGFGPPPPKPRTTDWQHQMNLLKAIIREGHLYISPHGAIALQYSNLIGSFIRHWLQAQKDLVVEETSDREKFFDREVPFTAPEVLQVKDWVRGLENRGLRKTDPRKFGYEYSHRVQVMVLRRKEKHA